MAAITGFIVSGDDTVEVTVDGNVPKSFPEGTVTTLLFTREQAQGLYEDLKKIFDLPPGPDQLPPNRLVVVDETGVIYDRTGVDMKPEIQDDGLTVKVFVAPLPVPEKVAAQARADHLANLGRDMKLPR